MSKQSLVKRVTLSLAIASLFVGSQCYGADDPLPGAQEGMLVGGGVPGKLVKAVPAMASEASPSEQPGSREGILVGGNYSSEVIVAQGFTGGDSARKNHSFADSEAMLGAREGILVGGNASFPSNAGPDGNQRTAAK